MSSWPIIAAIFTRDFQDAAPAGRIRTLKLVNDALQANFEVRPHHLHLNLGSMRKRLHLAAQIVVGVMRGRPVPLQVALFENSEKSLALARQILRDNPVAVYLDSVRASGVLFALRRLAPHLRIVMDMDDLMSRRMEILLRRRLPISLGYAAEKIPRHLRNLAEGALGTVFQTYERWALLNMERRICQAADAVTLVSDKEAAILTRRLPPDARATILTLPPPMAQIDQPQPVVPPIRFCFVGSDKFLQNRQTIDYLLAQWERLRPKAQLLIVGKQQRASQAAPGVIWRGMVPDLRDIYQPGTVLLAPSFVEGGIKTKVLEAFAYGVPVVGTDATFEGMALDNYPLRVPDTGLDAIVQDPQAFLADFERATQMGAALLQAHHEPHRYAQRWRSTMQPDIRPR